MTIEALPSEAIARLTQTLRQPRSREAMHRRPGAFVISAGGQSHTLELPFGATRIIGGRRAPADIVLDDASVSVQHFELSMDGADLMLRDLGSTNGTWIGGVRLESVALPLGVPFVAGRVPVVVEQIAQIERPVSADDRFGELVGSSPQMRELFALLARIAPTSLDVLVLGETGTGKELVARAIHEHGTRAAGPLVVLDCSSLPAELAESEINGHRKGAFTGANSDHVGCFEAAHRGTIFLDEVGELPLELQPKLDAFIEHVDWAWPPHRITILVAVAEILVVLHWLVGSGLPRLAEIRPGISAADMLREECTDGVLADPREFGRGISGHGRPGVDP